MPYCLGIGSTRVGPGLHPQYTRADYGQEAVGGPKNSTTAVQVNVQHKHDVQEPNDAPDRARPEHGSGATAHGSAPAT